MYGSSKLTFMSQLLTVGLGTFIIKSRGSGSFCLNLSLSVSGRWSLSVSVSACANASLALGSGKFRQIITTGTKIHS